LLEEKITNTEVIFRGRVVNLDVHDIQLPDGTSGKRELINHSGAVAIVALDENDNVLLIRQYRLGAKQVMIEIPAGTLEPGEDPTACAIRELQEETGFHPGHIESLGGWFVAPGYSTEYIHLFLARNLTESRLDGDADEFIELFRVPLAEAIVMIDRGEIFNTTAICGLLRVTRHMRR
jgi:ADP-ribose pyrophosphatase